MKNDDVSNNNHVGDQTVAVCPSFSSYYSDRQAAVARAFKDVLASRSGSPRSELDEDEFGFATGRFDEVEEDDGFEFSILCNDDVQIYPIFDREVIGEAAKVDAASVSLKKLFIDEARGDYDSESEAEDELESVSVGTYCVWKPKTSPLQLQSPSPGRCKKSKSTGSCSKRWKLRDLLLRRSNSDGKDSFVYLTTSASSSASSSTNLNSEQVARNNVVKVKPVMTRGSGEHNKSAHEMFYVEKRAVKEEDKKKSYLPYKKGLVGFGFFPNAMGVTNNFRPF